MGRPDRRDDDTLSLSDQERINAVQDPFEEAWRRGAPIPIEEALARAGLPLGPALDRLLANLLAIELEGRVGRGERPRPEQYRAQFPDRAAAIDAAFLELPGLVARHRSEGLAARAVGPNLLFGLLALQNGFVGRKELVAAFGVWLADRSRPLSSLLLQGGLSLEDHALVEAIALSWCVVVIKTGSMRFRRRGERPLPCP
jgi:hypothetical protein